MQRMDSILWNLTEIMHDRHADLLASPCDLPYLLEALKVLSNVCKVATMQFDD